MKKNLLLLSLLLLSILPIKGQTYCYKHLFDVDKDGIKHEQTGYTYFTFTNNKTICYQSDKNGNVLKSTMPGFNSTASTFRYVETKNNMHMYKESDKNFGMGVVTYGMNFYYFSTDYSRLNAFYPAKDLYGIHVDEKTYVYERVSSPIEDSAPRELY